ncbi:MAG: PIN domain-containing protein [Acidobacteriota bacterium]
MYLLDTDILTHLQTGQPQVIGKFQELAEDEIATTVISIIELMQGRFSFVLKAATGTELLRAQHWLDKTEEFLAQFMVIPLNQAACECFDQLRAVSVYRKIGRADLLIASIALASQATLVTRNVKHFRQIPNLKVENWMS